MSEFKFPCPNCGQRLAAEQEWSGQTIQCPSCTRDLVIPAAHAPPLVRVAMAPGIPPAPPHAPRPVAPLMSPEPVVASGGRPGLAIASLCLGIGSLFCTFLTGIPAIVCGHMALRRINSGRASGGKGMALTGLLMGYGLTAVGIVSALYFTNRVREGFKELEAASRQVTLQSSPNPGDGNVGLGEEFPDPPVGGATANSGTKRRDPPLTLDPATAEIPSSPVAGTINGVKFTSNKSSLRGGVLQLQQGQGFLGDQEIMLFLFVKPNEALPGKKYLINPAKGFGSPHVHFRSKGNNGIKQEAVMGGYVMRLEFGQPANKRMPGKIYLELPQSYGVKVAGSFDATME